MAFKKDIELEVFGEKLFFPEAYHLVSNIIGNKNELNVTLSIYKNHEKIDLLKNLSFKFSPENKENSLRWDKQGYEYLKSLDDYKNVLDC